MAEPNPISNPSYPRMLWNIIADSFSSVDKATETLKGVIQGNNIGGQVIIGTVGALANFYETVVGNPGALVGITTVGMFWYGANNAIYAYDLDKKYIEDIKNNNKDNQKVSDEAFKQKLLSGIKNGSFFVVTVGTGIVLYALASEYGTFGFAGSLVSSLAMPAFPIAQRAWYETRDRLGLVEKNIERKFKGKLITQGPVVLEEIKEKKRESQPELKEEELNEVALKEEKEIEAVGKKEIEELQKVVETLKLENENLKTQVVKITSVIEEEKQATIKELEKAEKEFKEELEGRIERFKKMKESFIKEIEEITKSMKEGEAKSETEIKKLQLEKQKLQISLEKISNDMKVQESQFNEKVNLFESSKQELQKNFKIETEKILQEKHEIEIKLQGNIQRLETEKREIEIKLSQIKETKSLKEEQEFKELPKPREKHEMLSSFKKKLEEEKEELLVQPKQRERSKSFTYGEGGIPRDKKLK